MGVSDSMSLIVHWADDTNMTLILKQRFLVFLLVGRQIGLRMSMIDGMNIFLMTIQRKSKNGNKGTVAHILIDKANLFCKNTWHPCGGWGRRKILLLRA